MLWALVVFVAGMPAGSSSFDSSLKFRSLADCRAAETDMNEFLGRQQLGGAAQCVSLSAGDSHRANWAQMLRRVH